MLYPRPISTVSWAYTCSVGMFWTEKWFLIIQITLRRLGRTPPTQQQWYMKWEWTHFKGHSKLPPECRVGREWFPSHFPPHVRAILYCTREHMNRRYFAAGRTSKFITIIKSHGVTGRWGRLRCAECEIYVETQDFPSTPQILGKARGSHGVICGIDVEAWKLRLWYGNLPSGNWQKTQNWKVLLFFFSLIFKFNLW